MYKLNLLMPLYGLEKPLILTLYSFWIANADVELVALYFESKSHSITETHETINQQTIKRCY